MGTSIYFLEDKMYMQSGIYGYPVTLLPNTTISKNSFSPWTCVILNRRGNFSGYDWVDLYLDVILGPTSNTTVEVFMMESTSLEDGLGEYLGSVDVPAGTTGLFYVCQMGLYSTPKKIIPTSIKFRIRSGEDMEVALIAVPAYKEGYDEKRSPC